MRKVPEVTFVFWVMKICATTLGETAGDLFSMTMNIGYGVSSLILRAAFFVALAAQLACSRYVPPVFGWSSSRRASPARQSTWPRRRSMERRAQPSSRRGG